MPPNLTPRQMQVLDLLVEGLSQKQIARRLGITTQTTKSHFTNIYDVTGQRGRVAVALWWVTHREEIRGHES